MSRDPRIDAYIAKSAGFAKPILVQLRRAVHAAVPGVEETIKWGLPHFQYKGNMCAMAAFKSHVKFGFWKGSLVIPADMRVENASGMNAFGELTSVKDLPPARTLAAYLKRAAKLNDDGVKAPQFADRKKRPALKAPAYLTVAVKKDARALATWRALPPSGRREYIEWVTGAKTPPTRQKRLATTVAWLAEGKPYNWKYRRTR